MTLHLGVLFVGVCTALVPFVTEQTVSLHMAYKVVLSVAVIFVTPPDVAVLDVPQFWNISLPFVKLQVEAFHVGNAHSTLYEHVTEPAVVPD